MERPIDANALFDFLTDQLDKETGAYSKGRNAGIHIARSALHDETITPTIVPPPNDPLTLSELRGMDDADVWASYPSGLSEERLIMHALVEVVKENGVVWLTNNLGGRSTFDEVRDDGGLVYRRRPEEGTP